MARLEGAGQQPSLLARAAFFAARRRLGRVPRPLRIQALAPRVLTGSGQMEMAQGKMDRMPAPLVRLGQLRVATHVGCPF